MYRTILCAAAAGVVIFTLPARADETLKWRHVHYTASLQSLEVGDAANHNLYLFRLPGIAFFPDGSTGTTVVLGTSDTINDAATVNGYYTLQFNDGSELWLKYTGTGAANKVKGIATVIGGKGRYAEAKGDGTFEGARQPTPARAGNFAAESLQYIDNVINIKK
jgi:hypothetical protein